MLKYVQVAETIEQRIAAGGYELGSMLPARDRLATELAVGKSTVERAVKLLMGTGVLASLTSGSRHYAVIPGKQEPNYPSPQRIGPVFRHSKFRDVTQTIEERVRNGQYQPGQLLPTLSALRIELQANPLTILDAVKALAQRGVVVPISYRKHHFYLARPYGANEQGTRLASYMFDCGKALGTIEERISSGHYKQGQRLPDADALHKELGVEARAVPAALEILRRSRLVTISESGTYAREQLFHQVARVIGERMTDGTYQYALPEKAKFMSEFKVCLASLDRALSVLEAEGMIEPREGQTVIYLKGEKEEYWRAVLEEKYPDGTPSRGLVSRTDGALHRRLLRFGLEHLMPADPVAVERGRKGGQRRKASG